MPKEVRERSEAKRASPEEMKKKLNNSIFSFGINVARLANLPEAVLKIAKNKSALFEDEMNVQSNDAACTKLNMLIKNEDAEGIKLLWSELK